MFGCFRWVLAHMVMLTHLWTEPSRLQLVPWAGPYAVFGFYVLSGYLMTLVLVRLYGFSAEGLPREQDPSHLPPPTWPSFS